MRVMDSVTVVVGVRLTVRLIVAFHNAALELRSGSLSWQSIVLVRNRSDLHRPELQNAKTHRANRPRFRVRVSVRVRVR